MLFVYHDRSQPVLNEEQDAFRKDVMYRIFQESYFINDYLNFLHNSEKFEQDTGWQLPFSKNFLLILNIVRMMLIENYEKFEKLLPEPHFKLFEGL